MRRDRILITEMIDAIQRIVDLIGDSPAEILSANRERRDAVLWNFTVLGEAANSIAEATRGLSPDIGWRDPVRLRNRIVHRYWSVDLDVIVAVVQHDLPVMLEQLRRVAKMLAATDDCSSRPPSPHPLWDAWRNTTAGAGDAELEVPVDERAVQLDRDGARS
jgi:uncharacterized protein with HEPN domain